MTTDRGKDTWSMQWSAYTNTQQNVNTQGTLPRWSSPLGPEVHFGTTITWISESRRLIVTPAKATNGAQLGAVISNSSTELTHPWCVRVCVISPWSDYVIYLLSSASITFYIFWFDNCHRYSFGKLRWKMPYVCCTALHTTAAKGCLQS